MFVACFQNVIVKECKNNKRKQTQTCSKFVKYTNIVFQTKSIFISCVGKKSRLIFEGISVFFSHIIVLTLQKHTQIQVSRSTTILLNKRTFITFVQTS